jgi:hypothetical protein
MSYTFLLIAVFQIWSDIHFFLLRKNYLPKQEDLRFCVKGNHGQIPRESIQSNHFALVNMKSTRKQTGRMRVVSGIEEAMKSFVNCRINITGLITHNTGHYSCNFSLFLTLYVHNLVSLIYL